MFNWELLREHLEEKLGLCYYNGSKTELITYCPWCEPDSKKSHGHLYIKVVRDNEFEIPVFNCFKCGDLVDDPSRRGRGTILKLLRFLNLKIEDYADSSFLQYLQDTKKQFEIRSRYNSPNIFVSDKVHIDIQRLTYEEIDRFPHKKQYIQKRLGHMFPLHKVPGLVFDIKGFIHRYGIRLQDADLKLLDLYHDRYIGFVTNRGMYLVMRNIDNTDKYRYRKLPLVDVETQEILLDFYGLWINQSVATQLDSVPVIVMAEGVFDVLNTVNSLDRLNELREYSKSEFDNDRISFIAATLGKSYNRGIISILDYCKYFYCDVIILADSDTAEPYYKGIKQNPSVRHLSILWNLGKNDFGEGEIRPVKSFLDDRTKYRRKQRRGIRNAFISEAFQKVDEII